MRDKNHDGDTHKFFDHLDHDDDDHLTDLELMTILGSDPKKVRRPARHLLAHSWSAITFACRCTAEGEERGNVHEDHGLDGGGNEKEHRRKW